MIAHSQSRKGFSLLEIILAIAIFLVFVSGIGLLVLYSLSVERQAADYVTAVTLAEEGREVVRFMRKESYSSLGTVTDGGVESDGHGGMRFTGGTNTLGIFERKITVSDESETRKRVEIMVTWPTGTENPHTFTLTDYLFDWQRPY